MKEKRSKIREKLSLRAVGLILAMSMVTGSLLPVGVGAEELSADNINNEEIAVSDVMMYENTDAAGDEEESETAAETEEVIVLVSEENGEEEPAETTEEAEPETTEPEVIEPETTEPEVIEPEIMEPEVIEPETMEPEVTEPEEEIIIVEEELPADMPEEKTYFCELEEHIHTEECFSMFCELEEHTHTEECYTEPELPEEEILEEEPQPEEESRELYCGYEVHVHDDTCWNEEYLADCGMEGHEHSENCYSLAYTLMAEFAAAVELFPDEADYILLDFDEADGSELLDEESYYAAYAAFYEENPDIWATADALYTEATEVYAAEYPEGDIDAWMQDNGFWEAVEKFHWVVPTPDAVAEITAQMEEVELEFTAEEEAPVLYADGVNPVAGEKEGDVIAVSGEGIKFGVFNYTMNINKTADKSAWRPISKYFTFRGSHLTKNTAPAADRYVPDPNSNSEHDADGYTNKHATVERVLVDGYPVLDLTRNADGTSRAVVNDTDVDSDSERSLAYLFSETTDPAVYAYFPTNTILQKNGNKYHYDSADNAVDYDSVDNVFRVRSYKERTYTTAGQGTGQYYDFLPFNTSSSEYTRGENLPYNYQYQTEDGTKEVSDSNAPIVDYWFGMTMEVPFYMAKDGKIDGENMVFNFSGDDDVWVFIDDVLVLDLGGTHGTVDGQINFATGEIKQYLSWGGKTEDNTVLEDKSNLETATSFPTTLKKQFEAAGKDKDVVWSSDGETFADYTQHTLKFFYLERGSAVANCKLDFVLPTLPANSLMVGKELKVDNQADADVNEYVGELSKNLTYEFAVWKTNAEGEIEKDGNGDNILLVEPGTKFKIRENGAVVGEGTVGDDGYFTLKAGQSALFEELLKSYQGAYYIVEERIPAAFKEQYGDVLIYGSDDADEITVKDNEGNILYYGYYTDVQATDSDNLTMVNIFNNPIKVDKLSTFAVEKVIADGSKFENEEFKFEIKFGGELLKNTKFTLEDGIEVSTDEDGILTIEAGEKATLSTQVISGTVYEVREILDSDDQTTLVFYDAANDGKDYEPTSSVPRTKEDLGAEHGITGSFAVDSDIVVTVTNSTYDVEKTYDLLVTKKITGNMGDINREFKFEAVITEYVSEQVVYSEAPILLMSSADDIPAGDIGSVEEKLEFTLGHNDSYKIVGIPEGYVVTITEINAQGYDTTIVWSDTKVTYEEDAAERSLTTGKITASGGKVVFTNDKTVTIDTAVHLDYLPYILILTAVIPTMTLAVSRKRRRIED